MGLSLSSYSGKIIVRLAALLLGIAVGQGAVPSQPARNFLERAFGSVSPGDQPLLSSLAPGFSLLVAGREFEVERTTQANVAHLTIPDIPLRFDLRYERQAGIDLYRIRHAPGSDLRGEHVRFTWTFPEEYNESMTLDAGALQGQPLFLPNGKMPDNHFTNWGSLFFNRAADLAVGVELDGAQMSRHARRGYSRFTRSSLLQLMTISGNPKMEITLFAYHPRDTRFWWAEWYQLRSRSDPNIPANFFPILSPCNPGWQPGEQQTVAVVPGPDDGGRKMELVLIDDLRQKLVSRAPFRCELPVTNVAVRAGDWPSGLYRLIAVPAGAEVDPAVNDLNQKLANVVLLPARSRGEVLFVVPTDMWLAYATNGGHDYHGWRTGYDGSVGYAPTVMSSRQRRMNNFYYSLYERYNDIHHLRYLEGLSAAGGFDVDYATQHDVALGRIKLEDYRLVLLGNHCEFTTREGYRRFAEYLGRGGGVLLHGGDSFAAMVEYLPRLEAPRYIWQQGHLWAHLSDQPSGFRSPILLPESARPDEPIVNPSPGDAIDYLNLFHTSVGYWIPGSRAVIASTNHPIVRGLNLKLGDEVPGPWGGEVDILYEPQAWDVLIRSDRAAPEGREFGIDAYDPTPFHRVGLAIHKNERLGIVGGENFANILHDPRNTLFRELYGRTLHYLLDGARAFQKEADLVPPRYRDSAFIEWNRPVRISGLQYELPEFIDFRNPDWHRKPAPYAHYVVEGSVDGRHWTTLADRRHGPWRGVKTDFFPSIEVRNLRFEGSVSSGEPFRVRNVRAFPAR